VECDGATYRDAATARDRDHLRRLVLEGLGWRMARVWAIEWRRDRDAQVAALEAELARALEVPVTAEEASTGSAGPPPADAGAGATDAASAAAVESAWVDPKAEEPFADAGSRAPEAGAPDPELARRAYRAAALPKARGDFYGRAADTTIARA